MSKTLALFFSFRISLSDWYDAGILQREVKLYNELSKYFYEIYFLTYGGKDDKKYNSYLSPNIRVVPMPFIQRGGRKQFRPLMLIYSILMPFIHWKILKNASILKTNQIPGCWAAVMAKIIFKKRLILRCGYIWSYFALQNKESIIKTYIKKIIEKFSCTLSDAVVCSSASDQDYLQMNYKVKAKVIPNYVDTEVFKPLNISKKKDSICFVGRLERQKNLIALLEALKGLPYELTIIGNGNMRQKLERKAKENNINITFMNSVFHLRLPEILNQHEVFILPSLYEGTPKALLEAMSCGIPVIGTNVTGIKDIIRHKENGYLCETSPSSIRKAIFESFQSKAARENIVKEARRTVLRNFSLKATLGREISIYQEITTGTFSSIELDACNP